MSFVEEEIKPTGAGAEIERQDPSEWRYVETAYGAHVEAGPFTIRLHWKGPADAGDIRTVARLIAAAPPLYDALKELLKTETNLGGVSGIQLLDAVDKARAALALVDGPQTTETPND